MVWQSRGDLWKVYRDKCLFGHSYFIALSKIARMGILTRMMSPLTSDQIDRANLLVREMERIETELQVLFGKGGGVAVGKAQAISEEPKKRTMSPSARARIASAQRARWAKARSASGKPATGKKSPAKASGKKRRIMSPEARAKIAAAQKKRWAKFRRGK